MELCCENYSVGDNLYQGSDCMSITDAMSLASEVIKSRQGVSTTISTKPAKKAMKKETVKQGDNKPQPTVEQVRIAQLINTKKEDPKLKEKLRQVVDATQRSMEEAYLALHDSEFDPNRAVNLLLEGNIETEWSTSSKKKKPKTPGEKQIKNKTENVSDATHESESWDSSLNAKPSIGNRGSNLRGRGRNFRGRGSSFQQSESIDRGRRFSRHNNTSNNNNEEDDCCDIIKTRTFERVIPPTVRPVDTWDPKRPISSMLNQHRSDDWDEEEFSGSLVSSLVYTSSSGTSPQAKASSLSQITALPSEPKKPISYDVSNIQPVTQSYPLINREQPAPTPFLPPKSISSILPSQTVVSSPLKIRSPPLGANVTKPPPRIDKPKENQEFTVDRISSKPPVMTKLPTKAVEMPPNSVNSNIGILDIQFGSLDMKDHSKDIPIFSAQPSISTTKGAENKSFHLSTTKDSTSNIFSGEIESSPTASSLTKEPATHVSSNTKKSQQTHSVYSSYLSSLVTTSNTNSGLNQNIYSSCEGVGSGTNSACPPYQYSSYVTQPSQSVPLMPNLSTTYQNILGTQSYSTSSQSMYGSNVLPTSSYTVPYQSYSSTAQHKPTIVPMPFTGSKDFESGSHNVNANLASRSGVPAATSMLSSNQSFPSTKGANMPKNPILSNMPPLIGHQHPLYIGQGGISYFQPPIYYQDLQLMQQQRIASPMNAAYYDVGYTSLGRDGIPYNMNERILPKQETTTPIQHGNQMIGGCATGHLSSSNDVFGSETDRYTTCEVICDNTNGNCSDNCESSPSSQLMQSGMALVDTSSNDPIDTCTKSINSAQKKINNYD